MSHSTEMQMASVLVVEELDEARDFLVRTLEAEGFRVIGARDGDEALDFLLAERIDVLVADAAVPSFGRLDIVRLARNLSPETSVVMMSGTWLVAPVSGENDRLVFDAHWAGPYHAELASAAVEEILA